LDSNQVAKASDAARVLKLNTASFSEARNRYTASMPCKSRSRNEVGGAAALGDIPAAAAGTVAFLVAVAMILHLPRRESFRARTGRAGVGPFRFSEATKLFYRWQQSGTRRAGPNRRPNVLKQLQLVEFFRRQKRANLPASLRAGHCAPARSRAGRFRGSRCRWRRAVEPHPAGLPDRRSWPSGQDRAPPGASSPRGRARVRSFRLGPDRRPARQPTGPYEREPRPVRAPGLVRPAQEIAGAAIQGSSIPPRNSGVTAWPDARRWSQADFAGRSA